MSGKMGLGVFIFAVALTSGKKYAKLNRRTFAAAWHQVRRCCPEKEGLLWYNSGLACGG
ncbi:hypothetical protein [Ruminococcus callidus]|uniref:hypothetical protein n=1 Tax=Ruminococcus callidus TaxID=40519 RepID=UPI0023F8FE18|nr:hypothetical protein [Ruminococcus callidus]